MDDIIPYYTFNSVVITSATILAITSANRYKYGRQ